MAHRGLPNARLFTDLDRMEVGDTFTINVLDQVLAVPLFVIFLIYVLFFGEKKKKKDDRKKKDSQKGKKDFSVETLDQTVSKEGK